MTRSFPGLAPIGGAAAALSRKLARCLSLLVVLAYGVTNAMAHAHPKRFDPAPDSIFKAAPNAVTIAFSEGLEPAYSAIKVLDAAGAPVDLGDSALAPTDAKQLTVHLKPLAGGNYTVDWHVTSIDTHKTSGSYRFTVAP